MLMNAMHIGVCYRDLPLRPAYCRNPLVSRSRQVMSFLFWGGSMVLRQMFQIGRWKHFYRSRFFSSSSRQMKKRNMSTLSSTSSTCNSFRYCGSVLPYCAISVVAWYLCATICYAWCLRNWCLWQHLRRVMSLRNYCYAWCLRNWCLWQHQHLSTLLQGKYRVIAETWQMTMNYVLLRWARLFSTKKKYDFNDQSGPYWDKKTWTFIEGTR